RFGPGGAAGSDVSFTTQDADALTDSFDAPDVESVSPVVNATGATLVSGSVSYQPSTFVGTNAAYIRTRSYDLASGTSFTSADVAKHRRVLVIGPTVAANLFSGQDPVGQTVRVNGTAFQVVGETAPKGSNGVQDQDDVAYAPLTAV